MISIIGRPGKETGGARVPLGVPRHAHRARRRRGRGRCVIVLVRRAQPAAQDRTRVVFGGWSERQRWPVRARAVVDEAECVGSALAVPCRACAGKTQRGRAGGATTWLAADGSRRRKVSG